MRNVSCFSDCANADGPPSSLKTAAGGFASSQEVYRLMQREGESIGLTTVYRSLQSLVNDKIVDVLRRDDGEAI